MANQQGNTGLDSGSNGQEEKLPELYSKTLILVFAVLFSTIFAAVLLIMNLRRLGKKKEGMWVLLFSIAYMIATATLLAALNIDAGYSLIANVIGAAILNEYFWNKYIDSDLEFKKKAWMQPILIALAIVLTLAYLLMWSAA